jgi:hypothetical protein
MTARSRIITRSGATVDRGTTASGGRYSLRRWAPDVATGRLYVTAFGAREVNSHGDLAADLQIMLANTALANMSAGSFILL